MGGLCRIFVRGHANVRKRLLIHVCGFNLGLLMHRLTGIVTPRSLQDRVLARLFSLLGATMGRWLGLNRLWEHFWALLGPINKPSPRQLAEKRIAGGIRTIATG